MQFVAGAIITGISGALVHLGGTGLILVMLVCSAVSALICLTVFPRKVDVQYKTPIRSKTSIEKCSLIYDIENWYAVCSVSGCRSALTSWVTAPGPKTAVATSTLTDTAVQVIPNLSQ